MHPYRTAVVATALTLLISLNACTKSSPVTAPPAAALPTSEPQIVVQTQIVERVVTAVVTQVVTATPEEKPTAAPTVTSTEAAPTESPTIQATQEATSAPTSTPESTTEPLPTLGPDAGTITHGGNLRETPGGAVIAQVCPGDTITFLNTQGEWYTVRIEQVVADCVPGRVKVGNIGWLHQSLLSVPTVAVPTITPAPTSEVQDFNQAKRIGPIVDTSSDERYTTEMTLLSIRWSQGSTYSPAKPGKVYLLANIRIKNLGPNSQRNVSSSMFKMLDVRGVLSDTTYSPGDTCSMEWVDLIPNGAVEGCIAFEVPDSGKLTLIYAPYRYENLTPGRYLAFTIRP